MDIKKKDKKIKKKNALIAATSAILIMALPVILILWAAISTGDEVPLGVILLFGAISLVSIVGTLLALKERLKEIEGGELDEASKY